MSRPHIIGVRETHNGSVADGMEEKLERKNASEGGDVVVPVYRV